MLQQVAIILTKTIRLDVVSAERDISAQEQSVRKLFLIRRC